MVSTFFLTTSLLSLVMLVAWEWNVGWVLLFWLPLSTLEGMLLSANALKVCVGGEHCFCDRWGSVAQQAPGGLERGSTCLSGMADHGMRTD